MQPWRRGEQLILPSTWTSQLCPHFSKNIKNSVIKIMGVTE